MVSHFSYLHHCYDETMYLIFSYKLLTAFLRTLELALLNNCFNVKRGIRMVVLALCLHVIFLTGIPLII